LLDRGRLRVDDDEVGEEHALILLMLVMEPFSEFSDPTDRDDTAAAGPEPEAEPDSDELSKLGEAGASSETVGHWETAKAADTLSTIVIVRIVEEADAASADVRLEENVGRLDVLASLIRLEGDTEREEEFFERGYR
jgi:hypothetical protein